ncbi:MAG TPA: hypothetical protein PK402_00020 [Tepidisphaeraceae bacterium]|nr:hypothetical protein [Tepidisphaeraceae bacterium]
MTSTNREVLRKRARDFVWGPAFTQHYKKMHVSVAGFLLGGLFLCLTIVGLPAGLRILLGFRKRRFASPALIEAYKSLVDSGRIVRGHVVMANATLRQNPKACAPVLMVGSLAGTVEGDAQADMVLDQIMDRIQLGQPTTPSERAIEKMMADEGYQAFRKRLIPTDFTDGREVYFLDVYIDNELLAGKGFYDTKAFYFVIDPSPRGLILQIPQEVVSVMPPKIPNMP